MGLEYINTLKTDVLIEQVKENFDYFEKEGVNYTFDMLIQDVITVIRMHEVVNVEMKSKADDQIDDLESKILELETKNHELKNDINSLENKLEEYQNI